MARGTFRESASCITIIAATESRSERLQPVNHLSILVLVVTMLVPLFFQPITVQDPNVIILKFNWKKERIPGWENNKFGPSFETYDAMRSRVASERRLQQARNAGNKSEASRIENDLKARQEANTPKTKEERSEPPRDGYKYRFAMVTNIDYGYETPAKKQFEVLIGIISFLILTVTKRLRAINSLVTQRLVQARRKN